MRHRRVPLALLLLFGLFACKSEGLRVTTIQLGSSVNADETVARSTTRFTPDETVYISIHTAGVGSGKLGVRWRLGTRVLSERTEQVSFRDVAATEFHLQSAGGFPLGDYEVDALLNGQPVGTRSFRVEKARN